ncbi:hypothetical protein J6590_035181 [Homalodisca vitripennis]|nr:hypothetical protein J6590_035181 [Homalodisca vitripennis]
MEIHVPLSSCRFMDSEELSQEVIQICAAHKMYIYRTYRDSIVSHLSAVEMESIPSTSRTRQAHSPAIRGYRQYVKQFDR